MGLGAAFELGCSALYVKSEIKNSPLHSHMIRALAFVTLAAATMAEPVKLQVYAEAL
jgi:hypothetical protein